LKDGTESYKKYHGRFAGERTNHSRIEEFMEKSLIKPRYGKIYRCLSCGATENMGRRRYCSMDCRQRLRLKLDMRTGLIQALNARFATFYFSDLTIMMDMLPYGSREIYSFLYPRSPGRKPAEDFSNMADMLGTAWWAEKHRTRKRYLASQKVLDEAVRNRTPLLSVRPVLINLPAIKDASLKHLNLSKSDLMDPKLKTIVRNAYRHQAKRFHPDVGGDAPTFVKIHQAYEDMVHWAENPVFITRRGFPDKWLYDGDQNRWLQPISIRVNRR
jgi:hypothetical protein